MTARLKWCCTEQSKKARLISLVSKRREVISWQRACANGWLSSPRRMSPASTPHRKSSPLGVRPIPSPMSPARCLAASPYKCCSRHSLHWRIRLLAAARIRLYSSLPFIAWPSVESQNRSRNMPACELATACRTRERSSLQGNGPDGQVNRVQQTFFGRHQKSTVCPGEDIIIRLPAMDTCWPGLTGRTSKALTSMSVMMLIGDMGEDAACRARRRSPA